MEDSGVLRPKNVESLSCQPMKPIKPIEQHIQQWLKYRHEMVASYNQLCIDRPFQSKTLQEFCQLLIDYISFGHFKMFEKLAESHQFHRPESYGLNKKVINKISLTTDPALNFNDKYTDPKSLDALPHDLFILWEKLEERMGLEDKLIKMYSNYSQA